MKAHTPLPWRVFHSGSDGPRIMPDTGDKREDIKFIAMVNGRDFHADAGNAEFIVRAVNAHDDLLEACKASLIEFEASHEVMLLNPAMRGVKEAAIISSLRAAISKAEGK